MPSYHTQPRRYAGKFIHTPSLGQLEILDNTIIAVDERGVIREIVRDGQKMTEEYAGWESIDWEGDGRFWFPGFVGM